MFFPCSRCLASNLTKPRVKTVRNSFPTYRQFLKQWRDLRRVLRCYHSEKKFNPSGIAPKTITLSHIVAATSRKYVFHKIFYLIYISFGLIIQSVTFAVQHQKYSKSVKSKKIRLNYLNNSYCI